jgi:hypothetical protein
MKQKTSFSKTTALFLVMVFPIMAFAAESVEELAKKTLNPVADVISLPIQFNQDYNIGPADAKRTVLNIQPVIPAELNKDTNVIIRTIIPLIKADSPVPGGEDESGLGDILQSFFVSPRELVGGWIMGFGPAFQYPSARNHAIGSQKWCAGPTAVVLRQESGFTYGLLTNHIWSFAGTDSRDNISATFLQPFFYYTTKTYTSFGVNIESTYDWENRQWTIPVNIMLSQMLKLPGGQPLSLQLGYRTYTEAPKDGPNWGLRFAITFLFPKG